MKLAGISLALMSLLLCGCIASPPAASNLQDARKQSPSAATLGDVEVTATAVQFPAQGEIAKYRLKPKPGYHYVFVETKFKNVAKYPNCTTTSIDRSLRVKEGFEYPAHFGNGPKRPQIGGLLPTDEAVGTLVFQVKDGTQPDVLRLVRNPIGDEICAQFQHRPTGVAGPTEVNLPLNGLSSK